LLEANPNVLAPLKLPPGVDTAFENLEGQPVIAQVDGAVR
jgi:hypothetical protein